MSEPDRYNAILIDPEHINVMIWAGLWIEDALGGQSLCWPVVADDGTVIDLARLTRGNADTVGQMLVNTNTRAVNDDNGLDDFYIYSYTEPVRREWSIVEILKAIQFYERQNAINDNWHRCDAYYFCQILKSALIHQLSGWLGAPEHITSATMPALVKPY